MSGVGQSEEGEASTSGMMETSMMESEEYYNPEDTSSWTQKEMSEQLCRICAKPNQYLIPIFEGEGIEHQLESKIQKHLPIEVSETDELPLQVCYQCASTLIAWNDLVIACIEADRKLRQMLDHQEEEDDDDKGVEFFDEPVLDSEEGEETTQHSTSPATVTSNAQSDTTSTKKSPDKSKKSKLQTALLKSSTAGPSGQKTLHKKPGVNSKDDAVQEGTERFRRFSGWSPPPPTKGKFLVKILAEKESNFSDKKINFSDKKKLKDGIFTTDEESNPPSKNSFSKGIFTASGSNSPTKTKNFGGIFTDEEESNLSSKNEPPSVTFTDGEESDVSTSNKFSSRIFDADDEEWNNGGLLDSEHEETRNKEIVARTCPLCGKDGMDEDEYKAHGITHIEENSAQTEVESFSIEIKKANRSRITVNHIKCALAGESASNRLIYSCSYCGQGNIFISSLSMHIKKRCLTDGGESEASSNEDTMDTMYEVTFLTDEESCDSRTSNRSRSRSVSRDSSIPRKPRDLSNTRKLRDQTDPYVSRISEITQNNIVREIAAVFNPSVMEPLNTAELQPYDISTLAEQTMDVCTSEPQQRDPCISQNEPSNVLTEQYRPVDLAAVEYETFDVSIVQQVMEVCTSEVVPSDMPIVDHQLVDVSTSKEQPSDMPAIEQVADVSTSDQQSNKSDTEHKPPPTSTEAKLKIISKEALVECLASAGDNMAIQVALEEEMFKSEIKMLRQEVSDGTNLLKCNECGDKFVFGTQLVRHKRKKHPINQQFLCLICGRVYSGGKQLHRHVLSHKKDAVACSECNKVFHNKSMLKMHTLIHTGKLPNECSMCGKGFIFHVNLQQHCMLEHNIVERNFPCIVCGQAFKTDNGLTKHQEREHSKEQDHLCAVCGKVYPTKGKLANHMVTHGPRKHVCEICDYKFYSSHMLKNHMLRHQNKKDFICETCGETFYLPSELKRHKFNHHTDELPEKCPHCDRAFKFPHRLKQHLILSHRLYQEGKQIFSCEICSQLFVSQQRLTDHMNLHTGSRPYPCSICGHMFRSRHSLSQHIARHKQDQKPKNTYPCSTCGRKFKTEQTLRIHNQSFHCGEAEASPPMHPCNVCDKTFITAWMLRRHSIMYHTESGILAHKRHICIVCNEPFYSKEKLAQHRREVHPLAGRSGRPYQCKQCDKSYQTNAGLYQHRVGKHDLTLKSYPCEICDKVLNSAASLYLHNRRKHGINAREYICDECGRSFSLKTSLLKHKLTHMDMKDREVYPCEICSKELTTKWSLKVHMRAHKGIKPFACDVCGRAFTQSGDRNKHRLTAHRETPRTSALL